MLKKMFRLVFTLCGMLLGLGVAQLILDFMVSKSISLDAVSSTFITIAVIFLFGIIFYSIYSSLDSRSDIQLNVIIPKLIRFVPAEELIPGLILLVVGFLLASALSSIIMNIKALDDMYLNVLISIMLYISIGYYGWSNGRRIGRSYKDRFQNSLPSEFFRRKSKTKNQAVPKILDTSVIIDGRIYEILKTGFVEGDIIIPDFVMVELRHISDSADELKRNRGRRGLDILNQIKEERGIEIYNTSSNKEINKIHEVDLKLLKLADILNGAVITNDYNLNKVATLEGISILNINALANTLKPVALPGEIMLVTPLKEGRSENQSVAYLEDGTMIVIQGGRKYIGKTIEVTVTSVLQTDAGRMIFVKP